MKAEKGTGINWFSDLMALSLLVAMVLYFSYEMVWEDKVPFFRDLAPYSYPIRFSVAESFNAGELPLWDRHMAMGFPLLADFQSGSFYPLHLLHMALTFFTAIKVIFILHYWIAAGGSYWLCRQWKYPPWLAVVGATLFTFGGTIISLSNLLNHFQTAVWLPWVILLGERLIRLPSWKHFLFLTLVLLLQFLAGSPEIYALSVGLLFLDGLRIKTEEGHSSFAKILWPFLAANALVAGLAMVQILPTAELLLESRVRHRIPYSNSVVWSLHPLSLLNLFFLDKEIVLGTISGVKLFVAKDIPFLLSLYMGAIVLPGICFWALKSSWKEKIVFSGLVAAFLILALGSYTPLYVHIFRWLPALNLVRFPEKFFFFTHALLLFVALRGLFRVFASEGSPAKGPILLLSWVCGLFFFFYTFLRLDKEALLRFIGWATQMQPLSPVVLDRSAGLLVQLERQMVLTFGILLLFLLKTKGGARREILFKLLLVSLVFIDLGSAHKPYQYLFGPKLVSESPKVLAAPDSEPDRLFFYPGSSDLHPSYYFILRNPSVAELNSIILGNLLPNTGVFYGFDYMQEIDALLRWPYRVFLDVANKLPPERQYLLLGSLNVRYVTSFQSLSGKGVRLVRYFPEHPSWLYTVNKVIPRTYIVSKVLVEQEPQKVLAHLSSADFDPLKKVILEQPLDVPPGNHFYSKAKIVRYRNQQVTIHASLKSGGILVLADSFYPGWRAYVDGEEREILRANLFFRAVPLPAGEHVIEFRYQPRSFVVGLGISVLTLCGVAGWSVFSFVRRKRRS